MHLQIESRACIILRTSLRTHEVRMHRHEHKPRTQASLHVSINLDIEVFFDIFKNISIKSHPKHIPTPPKVSGFHLNLSHSKT